MNENPFSLADNNIIITGASSGIGRQCAISCSQMGATVVLVGRREEKILQTLSLLKAGHHIYYCLDITEYDNIEKIIADAVNKIGQISGFVHCAGIELMIPLNMMKPKHYETLFATNVIAAMEFTRHLSKKKYYLQSGASVVFISSIMSILGEIAHTGYCSSKGALISAVKSLALELAEKKIRVNAISPAQIQDTEMTQKMLEGFSETSKIQNLEKHPLGYGRAIDVANACVFLLSKASNWITGTNLIVDGGYSAK